jgi:hypothetical protein
LSGGRQVPRRAAQDVRDVDLRAQEPDRAEQLVEEPAGRADEGLALQVLVAARRLADEEQLGVRVADSEDDVRARVPERAAVAVADVRAKGLEIATAARLA